VSILYKKRVLLGITGSIAAYKAAELLRLLIKAGADVQVVMTRAAVKFISPLTFQALSGRPVRLELFDEAHEAAMGHIELARWADLVLVAPASAGFMARAAAGMADDLLTTLCLASDAHLALAPAMNQSMWRHSATRDNAALLAQRGVMFWGPAEGDQACGDIGPGRMLEPEALSQRVTGLLGVGPFDGVRVLITAGPTREPIDPVRFIGNRSSGKMGYALARAFRSNGARVSLVTGPVALDPPSGVEPCSVETALEMEAAVMSSVGECDIFVACAAVADYRPVDAPTRKIKKAQPQLEIQMVRNPDILSRVASLDEAPFTVGFAAETERHIEYAEEKMRAKGLDMIAANLVGADEGGFERDENALTVLWKDGRAELPMAGKGALAEVLVNLISEQYEKRDTIKDS